MKSIPLFLSKSFVVVAAVAAALFSATGAMAQGPDAGVAPIESAVFLSPENSRISFVGTHVGDDPKPRLGGFTKFHGYVKVDTTAQQITEMVVDIDVDSVWTEFDKLTAHLKNADFFEVEKFPTSRFVSTKISPLGNGKCMITGNLTLHGETKQISFQASFKMENGGLMMTSNFQLDRAEFGMNQMLSGVEKAVALEINVGTKTVTPNAGQGNGGGKSQSRTETKSNTQTVSLKLPNMT